MDRIVIPPEIVEEDDFARWLRAAAAARGMTYRTLSHRSGVDHSTISRLARGARQPSLRTAVALFRVLLRPPIQGMPSSPRGEEPSPDRHQRSRRAS